MLLPERETATNCFVAEDVDAAWDEIGKYLLHDALAYSEWNPDNTCPPTSPPPRRSTSYAASSRTHVILSMDEASERVADGEVMNLSPLCGGMPPEVAWPYLKRVAAIGG